MHQENILKETFKQENSEEIFPFLYKSYTQLKGMTKRKENQKGGTRLFFLKTLKSPSKGN